jgi:type IX secretion system PorP/SprF family membrane protein
MAKNLSGAVLPLSLKLNTMKRRIKYILLILVLLVELSVICPAQKIPIFSQYMFNKFILNPAMAGSEGYTAYTLTSRVQWMGFKDAPVTNAMSYQTRLVHNRYEMRFSKLRVPYIAAEYGNIGLGAHIYNDHRGILNQTGMAFTYAYHNKIELKEQLSFGLTFNLTQFRVNSDKLDPYEPDAYLSSTRKSVYIPDFDFGIFFTSEYGYLGTSASHILEKARYLNGYENKFKLERNYNLMGGYSFKLPSDFALEPSFYFRTTELFYYQIDASCRLYYKNQIWGGLGYRTGSAIILTLGSKYKNLYFGYACDFSLNSLQTYSFGTHELILSLKFAKYERKYKWVERY